VRSSKSVVIYAMVRWRVQSRRVRKCGYKLVYKPHFQSSFLVLYEELLFTRSGLLWCYVGSFPSTKISKEPAYGRGLFYQNRSLQLYVLRRASCTQMPKIHKRPPKYFDEWVEASNFQKRTRVQHLETVSITAQSTQKSDVDLACFLSFRERSMRHSM
jgi:hypothetical protein